jgi:NAD(P)-dependent dehydrogenase (short-subunit alcohol dehydrogenase family)
LVTAAAIYQPAPFLEISTELWDRLLRINLRGTMLSCQAAARRMAVAGGGKIVVFGSVVAQQSEPAGAAYSASKAAVASLARSMAVDLADKNIQVNCVAPGWVRTPMAAAEIDAAPPSRMKSINPLGRAADPEEIANLAWYLGHECPKFLTGETIVIDGGQTTRADVL